MPTTAILAVLAAVVATTSATFAPNADMIGNATVCATCSYLCLKTSVAECKTCFTNYPCDQCGTYYIDKCSLLDKGITSGVEDLDMVMPAVCPLCNTQLVATPADPDEEEDLCNAQAYLRAIEEVGFEDLTIANAACSASYKESLVVGSLFGPPSEYEMFTQTCHGPCQSYTRRLSPHFSDMLSCNCTFLRDRGVQCFPSAEELMCRHVGLCPDTLAYEEKYCDAAACGRNEGNEDDWREAVQACGSHAVSLGFSLVFLVLIASMWNAGSLQHTWASRKHGQ